MKNNKGFTLIELLAVIIILAVIALIATPIVLDVIKDSKKSGDMSNVAYYVNAIELKLAENYMANGGSYSGNINDIISTIVTNGKIPSKCEAKSNNSFVILRNCESSTGTYSYANKKVYDMGVEAEKTEFENIWNGVVTPPVDNTYKDESGASYPELTDKLIPVQYDGSNWKVADITQKWYDYNSKEWANAVILNNGISKIVGDSLNLDNEVSQMYVWIPRYEYKLPVDSIGTTGTPLPIEINFIKATQTVAQAGYNLHPGFVFDNKVKNGIWIAKFETNTTDTNCLNDSSISNCDKVQDLKVLPNKDSLRFIKVGNMFNSSRKLQTEYNLTNLNVHMSKYTEWTAVSFLTNSKYGRCNGTTCEEVTINNVLKNTTQYNNQTGCAGSSESADPVTSCQNEYNTANGIKASTTGNITGVYDMAGGAWEYVMGVATAGASFNDNSGFSNTNSNSQYEKLPEAKYYDSFTIGGSNSYDYSDLKQYNGTTNFAGLFSELLSDKSAKETWFKDYAYFVKNSGPWVIVGGSANNKIIAGMFASSGTDGNPVRDIGFRLSIVFE